jgi:hypothetical protein
MKTKMVLLGMMGCLGLATAVQSAVTLTLNPGSGAVSGFAASTVGWGFTLDSAADFAVISSSNFCLGNSGVSSLCIAPTIGTYTDFIATNYTIAGPVPESPAVTEAFDAVSGIGIGSFKISATAALGAVNMGQIVVTYDLYSVDPNAANFNPAADLISAGNFLRAPASVTVEARISGVPEPSYPWAMAGLIVVWLACRRRSREFGS